MNFYDALSVLVVSVTYFMVVALERQWPDEHDPNRRCHVSDDRETNEGAEQEEVRAARRRVRRRLDRARADQRRLP